MHSYQRCGILSLKCQSVDFGLKMLLHFLPFSSLALVYYFPPTKEHNCRSSLLLKACKMMPLTRVSMGCLSCDGAMTVRCSCNAE